MPFCTCSATYATDCKRVSASQSLWCKRMSCQEKSIKSVWTQFSEFKIAGSHFDGTSWFEAWNLQGSSAEAWNSCCWKSQLLWIWRITSHGCTMMVWEQNRTCLLWLVHFHSLVLQRFWPWHSRCQCQSHHIVAFWGRLQRTISTYPRARTADQIIPSNIQHLKGHVEGTVKIKPKAHTAQINRSKTFQTQIRNFRVLSGRH